MHVRCRVDPAFPGTCAALAGHLDPEGAALARDDLAARIAPSTPSLLLDMSAVDWMSSAGVGALMQLRSQVQANQGAIALFGCTPRVRSVLRVCKLENLLNVCDGEDEARQRLGRPPAL
ncbi:MAG TPA: STAS domain-containing protein [Candidatus Krumholzibacteria bacterium]|nr:STAS domain-containing protein [Candidatus Krumholzibacteria bacterium]